MHVRDILLNIIHNPTSSAESRLEVDLVSERRAKLEHDFIQIAVRAMIYVGVPMNGITSIVVALGVLTGVFPLPFFIIHVVGTVAIFGPAWLLARRNRIRSSIWTLLLVGTTMIFVQMWVMHVPAVLILLPVVFVLPTLVLPWQRMTLYLVVVIIVFWSFILLREGWVGSIFDWWTVFWLFTVLGGAFVVVGAQIQHVWDRFSKASVKQEQDAAEHARKLVEAQRNEELAVGREIERERDRFRRELHDRLGSAFTSIGVQAEVAVRALSDNEPVNIGEARAALLNVQRLADTGVDRLRQAIRNLRDDALMQCSLPELINRELEQLRQLGLKADLECAPSFPKLPPYIAGELLRVVQEAFTNVQRHARATMVTVYLDHQENESISLTVEDNGQGCDPSAVTTGFGLQGIQERVAALGGTFHPWTAPDQGFQVIVEVPLCM